MTDHMEANKRIHDAYQAVCLIESFVSGKTFQDYEKDALLRSAVERQLEIVGESLSKLDRQSPQIAAQIQELPRIVGLRNRLIHGYDAVDERLVWDIIMTKMPPLKAILKGMLPE